MDFSYTDEQDAFGEILRRFFEKESLIDVVHELDRTDTFSTSDLLLRIGATQQLAEAKLRQGVGGPGAGPASRHMHQHRQVPPSNDRAKGREAR